jgi:hypothetical protein
MNANAACLEGRCVGACRSPKQNVPFDKVRAGFEAASLRLKRRDSKPQNVARKRS